MNFKIYIYTIFSLMWLFQVPINAQDCTSTNANLTYYADGGFNDLGGGNYYDSWYLRNNSWCDVQNFKIHESYNIQVYRQSGSSWFANSTPVNVYSNPGFNINSGQIGLAKVYYTFNPSQSGTYRIVFRLKDQYNTPLPPLITCNNPPFNCHLWSELTIVANTCNPPTSLHENYVNATDAQTDWSPPSGSSVSWYEVSYRPPGGSWSTFTTSSSYHNVSNLSPNTCYDWRVRTRCADGSYSSYDYDSFCTSSLPCNPPTSSHENYVNATDAQTDWSPPSGSSVSWYEVSYRPPGGSWSTFTTSSSYHNVSNLSPNTCYDWRVRTKCTDGSYSSYDYDSFCTSSLPCNPPTSLHTDYANETNARIDWSQPSGGSVNHYEIQYKINSNAYSWITTTASTSYKNIYNLSPCTNYVWRVRTKCSDGSYSSYTSYYYFTTATPSAPNASFSYSVSQVTSGLSVSFTDQSSGNPISWNWSFQGATTSSSSQQNPTVFFNNPGSRNVVLTVTGDCGLQSQASYTIKVLPNYSESIPEDVSNVIQRHPIIQGDEIPYSALGADPVNFATGAYLWIHNDHNLNGINGNYPFTRYYNSRLNHNGRIGYNWKHSYDIYLTRTSDRWIVNHGDGHKSYFVVYNDGSTLPLYFGETAQMYYSGGRYIYKKKNGVKFYFISNGQIEKIVDRNNNEVSFTYSGSLLTRVTFPGGRYLDFTYTGSRVASVTDNAGNVSSYQYNASGDLIQATNVRGGTTQYNYSVHRITSIIDPRGNTIVQNTYDSSSRVTSQLDALGGNFTIQYNTPSTGWTTVTNPLGNTAKYQHDSNFRLVSVIDELNYSRYFTYDASDRGMKTFKNPINGIYSMTKDADGNVTATTDPMGNTSNTAFNALHLPTSVTNPLGQTVNISYSPTGLPTSITYPDGNSSTTSYSSFGQPVTRVDLNGNSTTITYNSFGDPVQVATPTGNYNFTYDGTGKLLTTTDRNGKTTTLERDNYGNVTKVMDAMGFFTEMFYDANGNILSYKDKNASITTFSYDIKDRLITVTDALGAVTSYAYDAMDKLVSVTDANSNVTTYAYNARGEIISYTNALGTYTFAYDSRGNRISVTDALGNTGTVAYDALSRPISATDALNNTSTVNYNAIGLVLSAIDANSNSISYQYDNRNRMTKVTDALGGFNSFIYDPNGNMLTFSDARGNTTTLTYNSLNQLLTKVTPTGKTYSFTYDDEGILASKMDANGLIVNLIYNDNYQVTGMNYSNGANYSFVRDNEGRITSMTNVTGTTSIIRDALGRITKTTNPFNHSLEYFYDTVGNKTQVLYPGGNAVTMQYNGVNLMTQVTDWLGNYSTRSYDANGNLTDILNSNGTYTEITRDALNRISEYNNYRPDNSTINGQTLAYDPVGNILSILPNTPTCPAITNTNYNGTYNDDDFQLSINGNTQTSDDNGSITQITGGMGTQSFSYGEENITTQYVRDGVTTDNEFNAFRQRIKRKRGADEVEYLLDITGKLSQVYQTYNAGGNMKNAYIYAMDGLGWELDNSGNPSFMHFDYIGHTQALTDASGNVTDTYMIAPFGDFLSQTGNSDQPFKFLGKYGIQHEDGDHYHIRAREYDASTGRFMSRDAYPEQLGSTQGINRFVYSLNNPLALMDVNGNNFSVVEDGNNLIVTSNIFIYGTGANNDMVNMIDNSISSAWSSNNGTPWTYNHLGTTYNVTFDTNIGLYTDHFSEDSYIHSHRNYGGELNNNFVEIIDGDGRSFMSGDYDGISKRNYFWLGEWHTSSEKGTNYNESYNPSAHEFGHILGLLDRYDDTYWLWGQFYVESTPSEGWENNLLGNSYHGIVEQRNINEILDNNFGKNWPRIEAVNIVNKSNAESRPYSSCFHH